MTRHVGTPGELERLNESLSPLTEDRREPVIRFLTEVVADCPACDAPIRRFDPKVLRDGELHHLGCEPAGWRAS